MTKYDVVTWEEEGTWTAHAPAISGAYGLGATPEEAEEDLVEAANLLFEDMAKANLPPPPPRKVRVSHLRIGSGNHR